MINKLILYNTLTRKKERFEPINPPFVGLYACGPTVYGDAHLGHARQAITFDVLFRYLQYLDYKVRYVRNITDVGHLEDDADDGEDKILKKARLESLEPMEVVQHYMNRYHINMDALNVLAPSIEPRASGHIIEQQELIGKILEAGYAYEVNGSVYFDVNAYNKKYPYGQLSGRKIEDLLSNTRALDGQSEKRSGLDFALWKKADPSHLMRWSSKWSDGYPGWHLECSAMSTKYLGMQFDIHGGGLDLLFPHHECEIAQNVAGFGKPAVRYWMHNNMITINGQKMGRSLGNFITLDQLFSGEHKMLERAYGPMVIRFFILQAHYRSTLDFSNEALQASEKGLIRLMNAMETLKHIQSSGSSSMDVDGLAGLCNSAMEDDMNTAKLLGHLLSGITLVHKLAEGKETISENDLEKLRTLYHSWVVSVLGLQMPSASEKSNDITDKLIAMILQLRSTAKSNRDFEAADRIRNELSNLGITIKDRKDGADWEIN
ncbi:MAG: cysteine--tRNA ligase [Bacteroidales bacterium]|nr:cysteine--tRNA ligase [Bacteroidales bacterium]